MQVTYRHKNGTSTVESVHAQTYTQCVLLNSEAVGFRPAGLDQCDYTKPCRNREETTKVSQTLSLLRAGNQIIWSMATVAKIQQPRRATFELLHHKLGSQLASGINALKPWAQIFRPALLTASAPTVKESLKQNGVALQINAEKNTCLICTDVTSTRTKSI